jgi:hypothetical protein
MTLNDGAGDSEWFPNGLHFACTTTYANNTAKLYIYTRQGDKECEHTFMDGFNDARGVTVVDDSRVVAACSNDARKVYSIYVLDWISNQLVLRWQQESSGVATRISPLYGHHVLTASNDSARLFFRTDSCSTLSTCGISRHSN